MKYLKELTEILELAILEAQTEEDKEKVKELLEGALRELNDEEDELLG